LLLEPTLVGVSGSRQVFVGLLALSQLMGESQGMA
jgi:hypothetical protein